MSKIEIETYWYGGADADRRCVDLAQAAAEAVHTLNYATMAGPSRGLVYPSNVGSVLSGIAAAVGHMRQLCEQLADFVDELGEDDRLYHDQDKNPVTSTENTRIALHRAAALTDTLGDALNNAYSHVNHLGMRDGVGQADAEPPTPSRHPCPGPSCAEPTVFSASGVPR